MDYTVNSTKMYRRYAAACDEVDEITNLITDILIYKG